MTQPTLEEAATELASRLNAIIAAAIDPDVSFVTGMKDNDRRAVVEASRSYGRSPAFPLIRRDEDPGSPALLLKATYIVEPSRSVEYLQVVTSTIGL